MTTTYRKLGIPFLYPENWEVTDEQTVGASRSVSFQSPEGALWVLQVFDEGNPQALAAQALSAMREEYSELEAEPISEQIEGVEITGFALDFYCLDFVVTAQIRSFRRKEQVLVLLCQAEMRDFDRLAPVFHAMLTSILRAA